MIGEVRPQVVRTAVVVRQPGLTMRLVGPGEWGRVAWVVEPPGATMSQIGPIVVTVVPVAGNSTHRIVRLIVPVFVNRSCRTM